MDAFTDVLIIFILILINGLFSMSELAIVSSRKVRLQNQADKGSKRAQVTLQLMENPSKFLSTVQVGITLIGIFNGAIGGDSLAAWMQGSLVQMGLSLGTAHKVALLLVVLLITFGSLIFGELVPKRIAMLFPEQVAGWMAIPMLWLSRLAAPCVVVLSLLTEFLLRVMRLNRQTQEALTEEDIDGLLRQGHEAGVFETTEHNIMTRASRLDDVHVASIMTPRNEVHHINIQDPLDDVLNTIADSPYSRFPVWRESLDNVIGIIDAGTLFEEMIRGNPLDIEKSMQTPIFVIETLSAMDVLDQLRAERAEMAIVVNEYGELEGVVTLRDLLKALVGHEIVVNQHNFDDVKLTSGGWVLEGSVTLERFREITGYKALFPHEDKEIYHTMGGLIMDYLGHIPQPMEAFEWGGFRFEVVMMNRHRIERLFVTVVDAQKAGVLAPQMPDRKPLN